MDAAGGGVTVAAAVAASAAEVTAAAPAVVAVGGVGGHASTPKSSSESDELSRASASMNGSLRQASMTTGAGGRHGGQARKRRRKQGEEEGSRAREESERTRERARDRVRRHRRTCHHQKWAPGWTPQTSQPGRASAGGLRGRLAPLVTRPWRCGSRSRPAARASGAVSRAHRVHERARVRQRSPFSTCTSAAGRANNTPERRRGEVGGG